MRCRLVFCIVFIISVSLTAFSGMGSRLSRANDTNYEPPTGYYDSAAGLTGSALKTQLGTIMSGGFHGRTYGDFRYASAVLDADPNHAGNILLSYNRASVSGSWDGGSTWNREHQWPVSLLGTSDPDNNSTPDMRTDEFLLRPCDPDLNTARSNEYYGPYNGSGTYHDYGSYWFPGDADKGDMARSMFYAATKYTSYSGHSLSLVNGAPSTYQMGDLNSLLHWNYTDVPDSFERRRNQAVYSSGLNPTYYQGNRNAYIDHPEYVWSVFVDQANDTAITTSTHSVDLGRVLVGASLGTQSVTINKTGVDGTYYAVTTSGAATSTVSGRYNAFAMDAAGSKATTVGLNASTATAGLKSGTVTVDNLDITTQGGVGKGANDVDDVVAVSAAVLDHAHSSFSAGQSSLLVDFGNVNQNTGLHSLSFDICNAMQTAGYTARLDLDSFSTIGGPFSSNLAAFSNLDAGSSRNFLASLNTSALGDFSTVCTLDFSDENLPGAASVGSLTLTLQGRVVAVPEPNTVLLLALAGMGGVFICYRRRSTKSI
jgi:endonuclease I